MILLNSLPDEEYETFTLILINGKQTLNYSDVLAALVNYEVRRQDKLFSSEGTSAAELTIRGRSSNRKDKGDCGRSKSGPDFRDLMKNQCAFYKELGHWKIDCPKAKGKKKELKLSKSRTAGQYSSLLHRQVDRTQTHRFSLFPLLLLLLVTQEALSGS